MMLNLLKQFWRKKKFKIYCDGGDMGTKAYGTYVILGQFVIVRHINPLQNSRSSFDSEFLILDRALRHLANRGNELNIDLKQISVEIFFDCFELETFIKKRSKRKNKLDPELQKTFFERLDSFGRFKLNLIHGDQINRIFGH